MWGDNKSKYYSKTFALNKGKNNLNKQKNPSNKPQTNKNTPNPRKMKTFIRKQ